MRETFEAAHPISSWEALRVLARALRWVAPFKGRFAIKAALTVVSLVPPLLLPWPIKMQIDHVAEGKPIDLAAWPVLLQPLVEPLVGASPAAILFWTLAFQLLLVVTIGALGSTSSERDQADANLSAGRDTATTVENDLNYGHSRSSGLLGWFEFRFTLRLSQDLNHHYRSRLFERIHSLPFTAFDDERIGDAIYRLMVDTPTLTQAAYRLLLVPLYAPLGILLVTQVLSATYGDTSIPEVVLAFLPLGFLATLPFAARIRRQGEASRRAGATTASTLEEGLSNVLAVQSLGGNARQRARFDRDSSSSFREFRRLVVLIVLAIFVGSVVGTPLVLWIARLGTDLVIAGQLSTGDFALLITYFIQAGTYSVILGMLWLRVQNAASGLQRVFALMDLPGEDDAPGAPALPPLRRELRVEDVGFRYEDGTQALDGVDVTMRIGEVTALVGPAGAGKTTLAWLVPRFLRATRGRVLFDGVDVAGASLASVRGQVAFVFQETQLFDATVEENLRIGRPEATDAELRRAAEIAGAETFIRALPQGWRTRLGRGGGALSVGQKQRLAIARALVRDAPVLILDEPTSALDPETERRLVAALREASRSRVVLVIAHRLSTIRAADQILFLDAGRIIERGTHDDLMSRPAGAYRRYVELQTRGAA